MDSTALATARGVLFGRRIFEEFLHGVLVVASAPVVSSLREARASARSLVVMWVSPSGVRATVCAIT
jgi:hypothetical protein